MREEYSMTTAAVGRPRERKATSAQFERAFSPVALEIGHLARVWNNLHEEMGKIFCQMISPVSISLPLAVWHSPTSDRVQRGLLSSALGPWAVDNPKVSALVKKGIKWIIDETEKLSGKRNDALHVPLNILMNTSTFVFRVEPAYFYGHPMAERLKNKDVQTEFKLYRLQAECIRKYAMSIWLFMGNPDAFPLPQIPTLPTAVPSPTRRVPRRKSPAK
jgi:hypothetical protein